MPEIRIVIHREGLPARCEICHQSDQFDPPSGRCLRCEGVVLWSQLRRSSRIQYEAVSLVRYWARRGYVSLIEAPVPEVAPPISEKRARIHKERQRTILIEALIVTVIIGIIAAIAIPNLLYARRTANAASAAQTLRNLHAAEVNYSLGIGKGNYTYDLCTLGCTTCQCVSCECEDPPPPHRSGYFLGPITVTTATATTPAKYWAVNRPATITGITRTGDDCFFVDQTGIVRHSGSPLVLPNEKSPPVK